MVFTKKETKSPSVMVETKKLSEKDSCCCFADKRFWRIKHFITFVLLLLNTIFLILVLCNQTKIESDKVGGRANYKMVQQIYKMPSFQLQQKQQIQQALQMYQGTATQQHVTTNTATEATSTASK